VRRLGLPLLRRKVDETLAQIHATRRAALWSAVESLLRVGKLWLSALGRSLVSDARPKHRIKKLDRLLGNRRLHDELAAIYRAAASIILCRSDQLVIAVDWTEHRNFVVLSAAVIQQSRALPIYNEVHPRSKLGEPGVQKRFLRKLKSILPQASAVLVVTDAGFQGPWFDAVAALGWQYIGRVRNKTLCLIENCWVSTKSLYARATSNPTSLGVVLLRRDKPRPRALVLFRKKLKGRVNRNKRGERSRTTEVRKSARRAQEPWLLVVSPELQASPRRIVDIYGARFQIEQSFRDEKSVRWGWALRHSMSRSAPRIAVLLLIATLAKIACELVGIAGEAKGLHRAFQANTVRSRRVLSIFQLGRAILVERARSDLTHCDIVEALQILQNRLAHPPLVDS
jgi:hypothetical protein